MMGRRKQLPFAIRKLLIIGQELGLKLKLTQLLSGPNQLLLATHQF